MAKNRSAALYMRMSTERQNYSISHQRKALEAYAEANGFAVVRVYQDEGKSGLGIKGRTGLLSLIEDVQTGQAPFDAILVYDVSRWGRFQDVDESAHYEYLCRRAGIRIDYCAEPFANDESPLASMIKSIKRAMAAEYSRELSAKVFRAQCRLTEIGFKQGGTAGYGLRRILIDTDGTVKRELAFGDRKGLATDRVIFGLGPPLEIEVVRRIYRMYLRDKLTQTAIAARLNADGVVSEFGRPWNLWSVKNILTNEKYTGSVVFNRRTSKLKRRTVRNAADAWVKRENAFKPIISRETFDQAHRERERRREVLTDEEMLDGLRRVHEKRGTVNASLLSLEGLPNQKAYANRFGSLVAAYAIAGLARTRFTVCGETKIAVHTAFKSTIAEVMRLIPAAGGTATAGSTKGSVLINGSVRLNVTAVRRRNEWGRVQWRLPTTSRANPDFVLCAQLDANNIGIMAYYLFPTADFARPYIVVRDGEMSDFNQHRHTSLEAIFGLS